MKNSYSDDARSTLPFHLFEWATGDGSEDGCDVAARTLNESSDRRHELASRQAAEGKQHRDVTDVGSALVEGLEELGFEAECNIRNGLAVVDFADPDMVGGKRRMAMAEHVIRNICKTMGATCHDVKLEAYGTSGQVTSGMLAGTGFGAMNRFNPWAGGDSIEIVREMDVNVSDVVLENIDELVHMWNGPYSLYSEAVTLTLKGMSSDEKSNLMRWIENRMTAVGIPGTTLEEVLNDMHKRASRLTEVQLTVPVTNPKQAAARRSMGGSTSSPRHANGMSVGVSPGVSSVQPHVDIAGLSTGDVDDEMVSVEFDMQDLGDSGVDVYDDVVYDDATDQTFELSLDDDGHNTSLGDLDMLAVPDPTVVDDLYDGDDVDSVLDDTFVGGAGYGGDMDGDIDAGGSDGGW